MIASHGLEAMNEFWNRAVLPHGGQMLEDGPLENVLHRCWELVHGEEMAIPQGRAGLAT